MLLHPKITLAATIAAIVSIGAICASVATSLAPLETIRGLETARPYLDHTILVLGIIAAVCTALAGVGRSFAPAIDNPTPPVPKGP